MRKYLPELYDEIKGKQEENTGYYICYSSSMECGGNQHEIQNQ